MILRCRRCNRTGEIKKEKVYIFRHTMAFKCSYVIISKKEYHIFKRRKLCPCCYAKI